MVFTPVLTSTEIRESGELIVCFWANARLPHAIISHNKVFFMLLQVNVSIANVGDISEEDGTDCTKGWKWGTKG